MSSALHFFRRRIGVCLITLVCGHVLGVAAQDRSERVRRFEADRQACLRGNTSQNFDSCMKEAKAFLTAREGTNPPVRAAQLWRNAVLRCDALAGDERTACVARIHGAGTVSGSVAGGGILRELVTTEVVTTDSKIPDSAGTEQPR